MLIATRKPAIVGQQTAIVDHLSSIVHQQLLIVTRKPAIVGQQIAVFHQKLLVFCCRKQVAVLLGQWDVNCIPVSVLAEFAIYLRRVKEAKKRVKAVQPGVAAVSKAGNSVNGAIMGTK